jgi:hypothetical protein
MTILALGAVLFGAVVLLVLLNDWRLHRREYDRMESVLFIAIGSGAVCSLAAGLKVLL